ncbi:MAG: DegT/DnrJ/EryC1/StrS aminotransferase family protein, partial [Candidatus Taylorbacteria bacterium]|nr:DegT/DnrJ/EryC1/StrS aminotransferase family protein [Candidatus Taylorbacteria bacterium]
LEDNCESLGSKTAGKLLGNFGLASTFSFFVGHHLSTIEGGMIATDDITLYNALLMARAHGWDRNLDKSLALKMRKDAAVDDFFGAYTFYDLGYNVRPTEIQSFLGNTQIKFWNKIVTSREKNFRRLHRAARNNPDFFELETDHMDFVSNFAFPVVVKTKALFNKYRAKFEQSAIEIRPIISGNMLNQPFYKKYITDVQSCPNAETIHKTGLYFGNNPDLTEPELARLCKLLEKRDPA